MKPLFTISFLFLALGLFAQPVNDDCSGIIDLGVVPFCPSDQFFTTIDATDTDIGNDNIPGAGDCGNNDINFVGNDVWFAFTTSDTITDYTVSVTGIDTLGFDALLNPQIMIYRGDCAFDDLALLACGSANDGLSSLELDVLDLDPNEIYFIRINSYSASADPNTGTFLLCVDEIDPINTIDQGGSNACTGELYDSGGPDGDYGPNENNAFSICPPISNTGCITFALEYYNIENFLDGIGDVMNFYDGPDVNSPLISSIDGSISFGTMDFESFGGVCYVVQASSGCLTVEFISDGMTNFEGFASAWQCSTTPCQTPDLLTVDATISEQEIIDNISTPQTLVEIDTIICPEGAYGTFQTTDNSELGLEKGLLLTNGLAINAIGPNDAAAEATLHFSPGDADLDYLSGTDNSQDACVVELDVFVATDELTFEYIFGSEEYPEYSTSEFNDIFAFFISGPDIVGDPNIGNQANIALIPGTTTPVQINSVNIENNWEYYRNNANGQSIQYDGLTSDYLGAKKSLTARSSVTPCNTYHLKLAIADRGDASFDSGVFISEIKGGTPNLDVNFASGLDYLIESCTGINDVLVISLSNPLDEEATYDVIIAGTATQGTDYLLEIPSQVTIAPGQTELTFPLIPLADGIIEGTETIEITLSNNFGCGDINLATISVNLSDQPLIEIFAGLDTAFVCEGTCLDLDVSGGLDYFWTPVSAVDDPFSATPETCPTNDQYIYVTGSVGNLPGCSAEDSIYIDVVDPQVDIIPLGSLSLCAGETTTLQAINNVSNTGLTWTPAIGLSSTTDGVVTATPPVTTEYFATLSVTGCTVVDSITVTVDPFDFPQVIADTLICQGQSVMLANEILSSSTNYTWTPNTALNPDNEVSGPIATPEVSTTYSLFAESQNGFCSATAEVTIEVVPAAVEVLPADTAFICLGSTALLTASTTTGDVVWSPADSLTSTTNLVVTANPTESTWYFATMTVGACTVTDSVLVKVDSLPADLSITAIPDRPIYCPQEIISLISDNYEPNNFPDIRHFWMPAIGAQSDITNLNLVVAPEVTTTYIRNTTNNACLSTDSITINVADLSFDLSWEDSISCPGEMLLVELSVGENIEWSPSNGLSCTDCLNPVITVPGGGQTYTVEFDIDGCELMANVTVTAESTPTLSWTDRRVCIGEVVQAQVTNVGTSGILWTPANGLSCTDCPNPMIDVVETTTYTVSFDSSCAPSQELTVYIDEAPFLSWQDTTICQGEVVQIELFNARNPVWSPFNENDLSCEDCDDPIITIDATENFMVVFDNECEDTLMAMVNILDAPNISIVTDPNGEVPLGNEVILTANTTPDITTTGTFSWIGNGNPASANGPEITIEVLEEDTRYMVEVVNDLGCSSSSEVEIVGVFKEPEFPSAFSPDNDGLNDYFNLVNNINLDITQFQIFNRWGQKVYDNETPATGWDGNYKDKRAPSDVYIYNVTYRLPNGTERKLSADVTLIR